MPRKFPIRSIGRDVAPALKEFRDLGFGRVMTSYLRWLPEQATKDPPPPNLPEGPHHRFFSNYYMTRDVRGQVPAPQVVAVNSSTSSKPKLIASAVTKQESTMAVAVKRPKTPNVFYDPCYSLNVKE